MSANRTANRTLSTRCRWARGLVYLPYRHSKIILFGQVGLGEKVQVGSQVVNNLTVQSRELLARAWNDITQHIGCRRLSDQRRQWMVEITFSAPCRSMFAPPAGHWAVGRRSRAPPTKKPFHADLPSPPAVSSKLRLFMQYIAEKTNHAIL